MNSHRNTLAGGLLSLILFAGLLGCAATPESDEPMTSNPPQPSTQAAPTPESPLFGRIWRISRKDTKPPAGAIYVFMPNGVLLETSCVETYRVAKWTADPGDPRTLQVMEDGRPAFKATVTASAGNSITLRQTLLLGSKDTQDLTLTPVEGEYVCPDLPK